MKEESTGKVFNLGDIIYHRLCIIVHFRLYSYFVSEVLLYNFEWVYWTSLAPPRLL